MQHVNINIPLLSYNFLFKDFSICYFYTLNKLIKNSNLFSFNQVNVVVISVVFIDRKNVQDST